MLTNETTWNIEDVDPTTGELVSLYDGQLFVICREQSIDKKEIA